MPTDLANEVQITDADSIGVKWLAPAFNGGSPIIDYRLWLSLVGSPSFTIVAESIVETAYTID